MGFFDFTGQQSRSSFDNSHLFGHIVGSSVGFVEFGLSVLDLGLQALDVLNGISGLSVGMAELDFQVIEVRFQLLLLSDSYSSGLGFRVQSGLHGLQSSLAVSSSVVNFFFPH